MSDTLPERLNRILPKIVTDDFLTGSGIGNEIGFYVFDYPPEDELRVRDYLCTLLEHLPKQRPGVRFRHVNLFDLLLDYLKRRNLFEKVLDGQWAQRDAALKKALAGGLHAEKLAKFFDETVQPRQQELVLVSGVGSVYPLVRTSGLLSNLQGVMGNTPLVLFYPGKYDQLTLCLFGKVALSASFEDGNKGRKSEHYYRAFKLVS